MRTKIMIALSVLVLAALNYGIYEKEQIKEHGQTLLLELAPVDPRSLMQGDYMRLRYAIERNTPTKELASYQKRGYIVILPDENNVAKFVRFHKEEDLSENEKLLHFHRKYKMCRLLASSTEPTPLYRSIHHFVSPQSHCLLVALERLHYFLQFLSFIFHKSGGSATTLKETLSFCFKKIYHFRFPKIWALRRNFSVESFTDFLALGLSVAY